MSDEARKEMETALAKKAKDINLDEIPVPELNQDDEDDFEETNEISAATTKNDVLSQKILLNRSELSDDDEETQNNGSKDSNDGNLPVPETKASRGLSRACKNMFFALLFFGLCTAALLYFVVFDNTDTKAKSTLFSTLNPTTLPSNSPTAAPTISGAPTLSSPPSDGPSNTPSYFPTVSPAPSKEPTIAPSGYPSSRPSSAPTNRPTNMPSIHPTISSVPSRSPTRQPSSHPTTSISPSSAPSARPSASPTETPSVNPTVSFQPTTSPSKGPTRFPTVSPSSAPTLPPEKRYDARLRNYLEDEFGVRIESTKANEAVSMIVEEVKADGFSEMPLTPKIVQRYAMLNMELALGGDFGSFSQDECSWTGIACNGNQEVTHIRLLGKGLQGSIPSEIGLLSGLEHLDIADNNLQGSIPEELYQCTKLRKIFLWKNRLSGTISDKIIDLWDLKEFHLSTNRISGRIPTTMRSNGRGIYGIRYFNVYDNQMTGPMPAEGSRLRQLFYLDLGRNQFSGRIPPMDEYVRLRHLYLDHNKFDGDLPQNIVNTGDNRLESLFVNDNRFTGRLPGEHTFIAELKQFTAQNNQFSSMTGRTCTLDVYDSGEMTEFKSDCNICRCGGLFCRNCYN